MPKLSKVLSLAALALISTASMAYYGLNSHLEAAEGLLKVGSTVRAEERILSALKENPFDIEGWTMLGNFYQSNGRLEESLAAYDTAVRLSSDDTGPVIKRLAVLLRLGRMNEAETGALAAAALHPENIDALHLLAWIAMKRSVEGAVSLEGVSPDLELLHESDRRFQEALRVSPQDAEAFIGRALVARIEKRDVDALAFLERSLSIDSGLYWGWQTRGDVLTALGRDDDAADAYTHANALAEGRPYSLMELAALARRKDQNDVAAGHMAAIGAEGAYNRGVDLTAAGNFPEAEKAFMRALLFDPEDDLALDRLEEVRISVYPADDTRRLELADRRMNQGLQAEAVKNSLLAYKSYRRAIRIAPQLSDARLRMARFLDREGSYTAAVTQLARVEELTRSQNERLVASDMMEVITRKALSEMESVHKVAFGDIWDLPTSILGNLIGNPEILEARIRWGVNPVPRPRVRIAILPLVEGATSVHVNIGKLAAEWLSSTLGLLPGFELISPEAIDRAVRARMATRADQVDPGLLGKDLGADMVIEGKILEAPEDISLEMRVIKVPGGPILWRQSYSFKGPESLNRAILEIARSVSQNVPLQGAVIRREGTKRITINLGRIHGIRQGDTVIVARSTKEIFVPGLDWPGALDQPVATARVVGLTERYAEVEPIEAGEKIRAGDIVKRQL